MSYTHTHLPEIEDLKTNIETNPSVLRYYAKYDGFVGSSESVDYFDTKLKEYNESKTNK
jgi:hypothetical protein